MKSVHETSVVDPDGGCGGTTLPKIGQNLAKLAHFLPILAFTPPLTDHPGSAPEHQLLINIEGLVVLHITSPISNSVKSAILIPNLHFNVCKMDTYMDPASCMCLTSFHNHFEKNIVTSNTCFVFAFKSVSSCYPYSHGCLHNQLNAKDTDTEKVLLLHDVTTKLLVKCPLCV